MNDGKMLQLVTFKPGNEEFAVDMLKAQEINMMIDIGRIPNAPLFVEEIMNLRGKITLVVDLRKGLGFDGRFFNKFTRIILVELDSVVLGFIVDSVSEVLHISESAVEPPPPLVSGMESEYIEGIGDLENRLLILLELKKVFISNDRTELEMA
jgi:purine-binding chemotaxis protein CheW